MREHNTSAIERGEPFYSTSAVPTSMVPNIVTVLPLQTFVVKEVDQPLFQKTMIKLVEIPEDQVWYWTAGWQAQEREAEDDLRLGRYEDFETMDDFIALL